MFKFIYRHYRDKFYDELVQEFLGEIPDSVREPALEFLADRRVLFEKFLSIQAYHIQKARIQSKKSQEFYDGALMIIRAFLAAVNKKSMERTVIAPQVDTKKQTEDELEKIKGFSDAALKVIHK